MLVKKYFTFVDYEALSFEEKIKTRIDAVYLYNKNRADLAEMLGKILGG